MAQQHHEYTSGFEKKKNPAAGCVRSALPKPHFWVQLSLWIDRTPSSCCCCTQGVGHPRCACHGTAGFELTTSDLEPPPPPPLPSPEFIQKSGIFQWPPFHLLQLTARRLMFSQDTTSNAHTQPETDNTDHGTGRPHTTSQQQKTQKQAAMTFIQQPETCVKSHAARVTRDASRNNQQTTHMQQDRATHKQHK